MSDSNLITPYSFQGHPYLIKVNSTNHCLEILLIDKQSGEEWECAYGVAYIENLTRKTGNFKQFEIFVTMLKSGLLKTSDCIALDLLTYEDLQSLRIRRLRNQSSSRLLASNNTRRYLIVTYTVEFDKINYPLPLEYCGPPDPTILQATIHRLEAELSRAHEKLELKSGPHERQQMRALQKRIDELVIENLQLNEEVRRLSRVIDKKPKNEVQTLQKAIVQLERNVKYERDSHHRLVEKLQGDKVHLTNQLERVKGSEKSLKAKLQAVSSKPSMLDARTKILHTSKSHDPFTHQRKQSPAVRPFDYRQSQRSRSASPRIIHNSPENRGHSTTRSQSRSRSSSVSSAKQSERQFLLGLHLKGETASSGSPRRSKKQLYLSSGSAASLSNCSEARRKLKSPADKSTTANVKNLESRVRRLFKNQHFH